MEKKLLIYLTAGYPELADSFYFMEGVSDLVDGIEIGIPFSDPLADGPTIQMASSYALSRGIRLQDVFARTSELSSKIDTPLYYMTYYNLVFHRGVDSFIKKAKRAGVSGLIVPDVPLEESGELIKSGRKWGLDVIMFVTPVTSMERARALANASTGFLYYVSVTGVTGERSSVNREALSHIRRLKRVGIEKDIYLGFGISSPDNVRSAVSVADGVIVGSALIKEIDPGKSKEENLKKLRRKIKWLRQGLS